MMHNHLNVKYGKSYLYCHHICGFVYLSLHNCFEIGGISESSHEDHTTETSPIYNFKFHTTNNTKGIT
jgi:hypothetical protein